jgi:hypothetical protein
MLEINISDQKSLEEVFDLLHDSCLELKSLAYKQNEQRLEAIFQREDFENVIHKRKFVIFTKTISPLIECRLILEQVKSPEIKDKSNIGIYTFNECKFNKGKLILLFCEDMEICIEFTGQIRGSLQDLRKLDKKSSPIYMIDPFRKFK